jgi:hypothetical protein
VSSVLRVSPLSTLDADFHERQAKKELKLKLSHHIPRRRLGGEEIQLLLILDLGTRWE